MQWIPFERRVGFQMYRRVLIFTRWIIKTELAQPPGDGTTLLRKPTSSSALKRRYRVSNHIHRVRIYFRIYKTNRLLYRLLDSCLRYDAMMKRILFENIEVMFFIRLVTRFKRNQLNIVDFPQVWIDDKAYELYEDNSYRYMSPKPNNNKTPKPSLRMETK